MERVECTSESGTCAPFTCNVSRPRRNMQLMNFDCNLTRTVSDVQAHIKVFHRYNAHAYRPFLIDIDMDWCDFLGSRQKRNLLTEFLLPKVFNVSNLYYQKCPVASGGKWVHGLIFDDNFITIFQAAPLGQYRFDLRIYDGVSSDTYGLIRGYFQMFTLHKLIGRTK